MTVMLHDYVFLLRLNLCVDPFNLFNWANFIGNGSDHADWHAIDFAQIDKLSFSLASRPLFKTLSFLEAPFNGTLCKVHVLLN